MQEVSVREYRERFQSKHDLYTYMQNNRKWKINSLITLNWFLKVRYFYPRGTSQRLHLCCRFLWAKNLRTKLLRLRRFTLDVTPSSVQAIS